jgi:hypothetical protein
MSSSFREGKATKQQSNKATKQQSNKATKQQSNKDQGLGRFTTAWSWTLDAGSDEVT